MSRYYNLEIFSADENNVITHAGTFYLGSSSVILDESENFTPKHDEWDRCMQLVKDKQQSRNCVRYWYTEEAFEQLKALACKDGYNLEQVAPEDVDTGYTPIPADKNSKFYKIKPSKFFADYSERSSSWLYKPFVEPSNSEDANIGIIIDSTRVPNSIEWFNFDELERLRVRTLANVKKEIEDKTRFETVKNSLDYLKLSDEEKENVAKSYNQDRESLLYTDEEYWQNTYDEICQVQGLFKYLTDYDNRVFGFIWETGNYKEVDREEDALERLQTLTEKLIGGPTH